MANIIKKMKAANQMKKDGQLEQAIHFYKMALEIDENHVPAWRQIAQVYESKKDYAAAADSYRQAIEIKPDSAELHINLAKVLKQQNKTKDFIRISKKAIALTNKPLFWIYKNLGDTLSEEGKLDEAISAYQEAIKIEPQNYDLYRMIGHYQAEKDYVSEAIASYSKAVELNSNLPAAFYIQMGNLYQKQKSWKEAIGCYHHAFKLNPSLDQKFYFNLGNAQIKMGQIEEAQKSYAKTLKKWYLVSHKHKLVYCIIPKNACTLFRTVIVENSEDAIKFKDSNQFIVEFLGRKDIGVRLTDFSHLNNPEYFKFVILRNPFDRLVSAYLDKFVKHYDQPQSQAQAYARPVIRNVYNFLGLKPDFLKSITFAQFVQYLTRKEDYEIDAHWRPQHTFLGSEILDFNFVGQFEKLDEVTSFLKEKFGLHIRKNLAVSKDRITSYANFSAKDQFHNTYPQQLKSLDSFPNSSHFYTSKLEKLVIDRYKQDIEIYEQKFKVQLSIY